MAPTVGGAPLQRAETARTAVVRATPPDQSANRRLRSVPSASGAPWSRCGDGMRVDRRAMDVLR
ncbi:hypothetical protein [Nocardiopsis halotolerans]|uniref:hypothetical protein n=1 Tax=Nocardiopsis halotolerans TaxID=124252 RepID=UPI00035CD8BB|nr:hypothetical protein [Nocardiopsis halotolerans]